MSIADNIESPRFWQELARIAGEKLPPVELPAGPQPMNEEQAIRFEASEMPYGVHVKTAIGEVPPSYLLWLAENTFAERLARYLRSARFKRRQETEPE